jgi:hypothetical protein
MTVGAGNGHLSVPVV